jgi:hypothetical protein
MTENATKKNEETVYLDFNVILSGKYWSGSNPRDKKNPASLKSHQKKELEHTVPFFYNFVKNISLTNGTILKK